MAFAGCPAIAKMLNFRRRYKSPAEYDGLSLKLLSLLRQALTGVNYSSRLQASDERDKISALLGLAKDSQELGIRVDHSEAYKPTNICLDVSRALLRNGDLDVLIIRPSRYEANGLPSRVCDWNLNTQLRLQSSPLALAEIDIPFSASASSIHSVHFPEDGA
ncbi:uncharacterized protein PAC_06371 [Phialocephala subalpina]|uniref:Uncharacterized protein n=1 Tax=Phialocephala subalpina TaxID=576137 RepID=A0A1L7WUT4_9HELO|nr:uncharacterized protein PAC_06371 [Phialocephala subalpina]